MTLRMAILYWLIIYKALTDCGATIGAKIIALHICTVSNLCPRSCNDVYITELVSNYFLGYLTSCVVAKHSMWTSDCIT